MPTLNPKTDNVTIGTQRRSSAKQQSKLLRKAFTERKISPHLILTDDVTKQLRAKGISLKPPATRTPKCSRLFNAKDKTRGHKAARVAKYTR